MRTAHIEGGCKRGGIGGKVSGIYTEKSTKKVPKEHQKMEIDRHVVHQAEITIKHLAKRIREQSDPSPTSVQALAKLTAEYRALVEASREDDPGTENYYDRMQRQALKEVKGNY